MEKEVAKKKAELLAQELAEVLDRETPTNVAVVGIALSLVMGSYIRMVEEECGEGKKLANSFLDIIHNIISEL